MKPSVAPKPPSREYFHCNYIIDKISSLKNWEMFKCLKASIMITSKHYQWQLSWLFCSLHQYWISQEIVFTQLFIIFHYCLTRGSCHSYLASGSSLDTFTGVYSFPGFCSTDIKSKCGTVRTGLRPQTILESENDSTYTKWESNLQI